MSAGAGKISVINTEDNEETEAPTDASGELAELGAEEDQAKHIQRYCRTSEITNMLVPCGHIAVPANHIALVLYT